MLMRRPMKRRPVSASVLGRGHIKRRRRSTARRLNMHRRTLQRILAKRAPR